MCRWWVLTITTVIVLLAAGCSSSSTATTVSGSSTTTIDSSVTVPQTSTSTIATTVPATTPTSSTTTTLVPAIEVVMPFDGETVTECEFGPIGVVRPEGVVTYLGEEMIDDGRFGPPYPISEGWHRWVGHPEEPYPLDVGVNTWEFVATFGDGSTISTTVTVVCDPSLTHVYGFITGMSTNDEVDYELRFNKGTMDDQPDGWAIIDTSPVVFDVDSEAVFLVYDRTDRSFYKVADFSALLTEIDQELCDRCGQSTGECPDRCFVSPEYGDTTPLYSYVDFVLLVDTDNTVLQVVQLDPTIAP